MPQSFDEVITATLNELEVLEQRRLIWGLVDGLLQEDDVLEAAFAALGRAGTALEEDEQDVLYELGERRLLFAIPGTRGFRTRIGEFVRLAARQKQMFDLRSWRSASNLVADYRYVARPRSFPDRNRAASTVVASLQLGGCSRLQTAVARCMLRADGDDPLELAAFQERATAGVLDALRSGENRGVLVGAGTGSGKTLAFYLPAFMHVAEQIGPDLHPRALAIYPRKELLKDQFTSALADARRLMGALSDRGRRPISLGTYYGDTPLSGRQAGGKGGWRKTGSGSLECPFLRCPRCGGEMLWAAADWQASVPVERLSCGRCEEEVSPDEIVLTRKRLAKHPPDFLFTTTEMLNRRMSDSVYGRILGVGVPHPPQLVLLDEVHTYDGVHGAQVAYLLRRWRHAVRRPSVVVGLSATLRGGRRFFARLTGVPESAVADVSPRRSELRQSGKEYLLALRSDPASGASLLSTTIQTSMLVRRFLDPKVDARSQGMYGSRTFVFTDDLDVTNRLFFDILDAEGLDSWGNPKEGAPEGSLANLRHPSGPELEQRRSAGQIWDMMTKIGHALRPGDSVKAGRTSSQDAGVDAGASLVVATAALEVGFDDPTVGAVIQHKAPRGVAQFLQRKGRAGRPQVMRPLTTIVLGDYGRDRHAYQAYGQLFDPVLPPNPLPLENRYVLKIQATYALMDWIAGELQNPAPGYVWRDFSCPSPGGIRSRQDQEAHLLAEVLAGGPARRRLETYLEDSLAISKATCLELLWEAPRAILMEVVPTIQRRLETQWKEEEDVWKEHSPLPEFMPTAMFNPLALPEVVIETPPQQHGDEARTDNMPVLQAMSEHAPGRVSYRFTIRNRYARFWNAIPELLPGDYHISIGDYASKSVFAGIVSMRLPSGEVVERPCHRPLEIKPDKPPTKVHSTSQGYYQWRSEILPDGTGVSLDIPQGGRWASLISELRSYSHGTRQHVRVWRFATDGHAEIGLTNGERHRATFSFVEQGEPTCVGFSSDVDGLRVRIRRPKEAEIQRGWNGARRAAFAHRVMASELPEVVNKFVREWLVRVWFAALIDCAVDRGTDLSTASKRMADGLEEERLLSVIQTLLGSGSGKGRDIVHLLLSVLEVPECRGLLHQSAASLWSEPDEEDLAWLIERLKTTVGAALIEASNALCPEFDLTDIRVDLDAGPRNPAPKGFTDIWLTENTLGGGGVLDAIVERYQRDPWRFFRLVDAALLPSEFEALDETLMHLCSEGAKDAEIGRLLGELRGRRPEEAAVKLRSTLRARGFTVSQPVMVGVNARLARAGASRDVDEFLARVVDQWKEWERRFTIDIDSTTVAFIQSQTVALDTALDTAPPGGVEDSRSWRRGVLSGLLWPHGWENRARSLQLASPFYAPPPSDRVLLTACLPAWTTVDLQEPDWRARLEHSLQKRGVVHLHAQSDDVTSLPMQVGAVLASPVVVGSVLLPVVVRGVRRIDGGVTFRFELSEVPQ